MQSVFDSNKEVDFYSILRCVDTSTEEQIKTEYKQLALEHHPDKSKSDASIFNEIKRAYDIIGNPSQRALYDKWKSTGLRIPFDEYTRLSQHAQVVHWQTIPGPLSIAATEDSYEPQATDRFNRKSSSSDHLPSKSFWKHKGYIIEDRH
ncbi:DnaJ domain-containing protein [Pilobolus umbonatus]|nr:DnaJ domain-containing protein [Pilobolus umbonatus]